MAKIVSVVDDDPQVVVIVRAVLEAAGFEVAISPDGADCLAAIERRLPDLIIMDVVMPGMNGIEVLHAIRGRPETSNIPVIVLSARTEDLDLAVARAAGADLYLAKPFTSEELVAATKQLLGVTEELDQ